MSGSRNQSDTELRETANNLSVQTDLFQSSSMVAVLRERRARDEGVDCIGTISGKIKVMTSLERKYGLWIGEYVLSSSVLAQQM